MSAPVADETMNVILLVEDDADHRVLTMRALKKNDITTPVIVATDGAEAVRMLFESNDTELQVRPRLILLDLYLPRINGQEVLRRIRAEPATAGVPVVVMSSASVDPAIDECKRLGANAFIGKPVDIDALTEALNVVRRIWKVSDEAGSPPRQPT